MNRWKGGGGERRRRRRGGDKEEEGVGEEEKEGTRRRKEGGGGEERSKGEEGERRWTLKLVAKWENDIHGSYLCCKVSNYYNCAYEGRVA